ncbi:conserved hypothetical protein [Vibrio phage 501E54-1]|nr:conserved hypothetical protein [Vibrio phage 501E54-1]
MSNTKPRDERIASARERLLNRYPDRDEQEAKAMSWMKGLTKEELQERYEVASKVRDREAKQGIYRYLVSSGCDTWNYYVVDSVNCYEPVAGFLCEEMAYEYSEYLSTKVVD